MTNSSKIKVIGFIATLAGAGLSVLSTWVDDKKMEEKINEGIEKALAERDEKEEES